MILLLLIVLALLLWSILAEIEPENDSEEIGETVCSACGRTVDVAAMVCPSCQQQLLESCHQCHHVKSIRHAFCPFCGSKRKGGG